MKLKIKKYSNFLLDYTNINFLNFISKKNVVLDIGCGEGEFLAKLAQLYPKKQFLGIEIKYGRIMKCVKKCDSLRLRNLKFVICDANIFIDKILPNSSLNKVFINNPDPWPKDRHKKNRILRDSFLNIIYQRLKRKGNLYIKTDSKKYYNFLQDNIKKTRFELDNSSNKFDNSLEYTKFQEFYKKNNKKIYSVKFKKK